MNKTKIIAKVEESNSTSSVLKELMLSGIDAFALDLNKVNEEFCIDIIDKINNLNESLKTNVAIMVETLGSKIHVNKILGGSTYLSDGDKIRIYIDNTLGDETKISVDYKNLVNEVKYDSVIKTLEDYFKDLAIKNGD